MKPLQRQVSLAKQIHNITFRLSKAKKTESWFSRSAQALDMELDEDLYLYIHIAASVNVVILACYDLYIIPLFTPKPLTVQAHREVTVVFEYLVVHHWKFMGLCVQSFQCTAMARTNHKLPMCTLQIFNATAVSKRQQDTCVVIRISTTLSFC